MRLILLLSAYWKQSGGDVRALELLRRWKSECKAIVLAPKAFSGLLEPPDYEGVSYHWVEEADNPSNMPLSYIRRLRRAKQILKQILSADSEPTVVYSTNGFFPDVLAAYYAKRRFGVRWVNCCFHIIEGPFSRAGSPIRNLLAFVEQRLCLRLQRRADLMIVDNKSVSRWLTDNMGFDGANITVQPCAVNIPAQAATPEAKLWDIIFCGRVKPSKGVAEFVDLALAIGRIAPEFKSLRIGVIGEDSDPYAQQVRHRARAAGVDLELLGSLSEKEKQRELRRGRVFVSLSHEEGWGIAIAEAFSMGLPVVAYDLPCYREVFPGLFPVATVGDIACIAENVVAFLRDPDLSAAKSSAGKSYIATHYSYDKIATSELNLCGLVANVNAR